ncbi:beta-ketoacyl synthase N-terminal-like domain-containing protein [Streptomyces sp. NPDC001930]|uniref:beta-ketoacyl synthase N-terminal-like domain-containing protein n=1 Tax=Streptomyces sp. NPDC001930 TaxID=3364625 RepID=UPI003680FC08
MDSHEIRRLMEQQLVQSKRLKARVRELEAERNEPLAVVGLGLRLPPDLTTPDTYWDFLNDTTDGTSTIPQDRVALRSVHTPDGPRPGRSYVDRGGYLRDVAHFDAGFFGISQREADALDPQQRLLLETAWEAMERAGIAVRRQDRLHAGVFIGIMSADYTDRLAHRTDKTGIDPYYGTGGGHSLAAGRISYAMGFSGPAMSVDTACSSSLVALHMAAQSLRRGECRYALAGGANVIFGPDLMVSLCQSKALAPDGRSKPFLDTADGYGRGEGVGVMVLMRLSDAEREHRPVLAVLRGSAVNHDGASSGLTVPNGPAQQEVIRAALTEAGIAPQDIGYVEAHGTGTSLGDPIEARALDTVLGTGAPQRRTPLAIGSVKARIGHLESAAGMAALIKVVLMLHHGRIPAAGRDTDGELNHLIPWDRMKLTVPREPQDWPDTYERRIAGVSAFGMSGTNAHAVLEAYDTHPTTPAGHGTATELLTLSAKNPESLKALVDDTVAYLTGTDPHRLAEVCATLRDGRTAFEHRIAVTATTPGDLAHRLAAAADAYRADTAKPARTDVTLRVTDRTALLEKSLGALLDAHPALAQALKDPSEQAPNRLVDVLGRLGVRVRTDPAAPSTPTAVAELQWDGRTSLLLTEDPEASSQLLLDVLAALYRDGTDLLLDGLRQPGTGRPHDLPTYPFRRKRCWIDEQPYDDHVPADPHEGQATGQNAGPDRQGVVDFLHTELRKVMHADEELDLSLTFLDAGGDSFTAMQLTIGIEDEYQIEVPLEEFDVELPLTDLFARLSGYIIRHLAPDAELDKELCT